MPKLLRLLCLFLLAAGFAPADTNPDYAALRAARPQGKGLAVKGLVLERDVFRLRFESGTFQLFAPIAGKVVGAVFVGDGSWELTPALEAERRHLALVSGEKDLRSLSDRFDSLVLLFTDATAADIERQSTAADPPPGAAEAFDRYLAHQRTKLKTNLHLRLLQDLQDGAPASAGVFLADVKGKRLPPALILVDGFGLDWFAPNLQVGPETSGLYVTGEPDEGFWYLAPRARQANPSPQARAHAEHYGIETTIQKNTGLRGVTTIRLQSLTPSLRLVPLLLMPRLRVRKMEQARADGDAWVDIPFIQEKADEDADLAAVLASPLAARETARLRITYDGDEVLRDVGDGNFVVGARTSWYPNLGTFRDLATFDLTFRGPKANEVVSVGRPAENRVEGDTRVSVWKAEKPIRVAGFNYGKFKKIERPDRDSGLKVEVFTNPGVPDIIREINDYLRRGRESSRTVSGLSTPLPSDLDSPLGSVSPSRAGMQSLQIDTDGLAESAIVDGLNTARVGNLYFGPLPYARVGITQQAQWTFGQSWPSLIFLPFLAAFDSTTRRELGMKSANDFVESVGPHEFAHQWWGHLVGWESYRDQWLSEGMADFTAALVLQHARGWPAYAEHWGAERRFILLKPRDASVANDAAGPITQGLRLATRRNPEAYAAMVYAKGSFVVHMLRMAMRDPAAPRPDAKFIETLRDFAATWAGKNPSTRDFQRVVERHMVPSLNATGDGKMDWFFEQWVYGTEIPRYRVQLDLKNTQGDQYRLIGSIAQEGVSKDFAVALPVYIEFAKGKLVRYGLIPLVGNQSVPVDVTLKLPEKPKRALVNAYHEVLSRD